MEQGVVSLDADDADLCIFQFLRYRAYADMLKFVRPYVRYMPPVWEKYMLGTGSERFQEANRQEVLMMQRIYNKQIRRAIEIAVAWQGRSDYKHEAKSVGVWEFYDPNDLKFLAFTGVNLTSDEFERIVHLMEKCPYMAEPRIVLACYLEGGQEYKVFLIVNLIQLVSSQPRYKDYSHH
jgi:hypothetical protein